MLFSDSDIVTTAMLNQIDSEVSIVAMSTKPAICLEGPGSICEQAWRECGQSMTAAQQIYSTYLAQPGMTSGHLAAVLNVGVPARTQPRVRLNQIVAHDFNYANSLSALQVWMAYATLAIFFREASSRLGKDRLEEKMLRYRRDALRHWQELRAVGLPMISQPLEAPGAKHSFAAGSWSVANLSGSGVGAITLDNPVQVAITWYDASRYVSQANKGNAESGPSAVLQFAIPASKLLHVDITSLNPPNGGADPVGTSNGTWLPLNATHWNIYVGANAAPILYLQKEGIPVATKSWTMAADPAYAGSVMQQGQFSELNMIFQNMVMRG